MGQPIYSNVKDRKDIKKINRFIRKEIKFSSSRASIVKLVGRSSYLITLTNTPAWRKGLGNKITSVRSMAIKEFHLTAETANSIIKTKNLGNTLDSTYG